MTSIAILDLTSTAPELADLPSAGETIRTWLARGMAGEDITIVPVAQGGELPGMNDHDGFVLSGSEKGVYDDAPWMMPVRDFILKLRERGKPLFGICFGHQLMADTFGGKAELSDHGMRIGAERFTMGDREFEAHVWHQDQVTQLPPSAKIAGAADYCPHGIIEYDFAAASIQFHPEIDRPYFDACIDRFSGSYLSHEKAGLVRKSIAEGKVADDLFVEEALRILHGGRLSG